MRFVFYIYLSKLGFHKLTSNIVIKNYIQKCLMINLRVNNSALTIYATICFHRSMLFMQHLENRGRVFVPQRNFPGRNISNLYLFPRISTQNNNDNIYKHFLHVWRVALVHISARQKYKLKLKVVDFIKLRFASSEGIFSWWTRQSELWLNEWWLTTFTTSVERHFPKIIQ